MDLALFTAPVKYATLSFSKPQYHLPELPQLNTLRCPSELNGAGPC